MLKGIKDKKYKVLISILSTIFILIGVSLIVFNQINNTIKYNEDIKLLDDFDTNQENVSDVIEMNTSKDTTTISHKSNESYLAVLEIPKINLRRGFFNKTSNNNNVNKNIYLLKESQMPNIDKGNLILAAHSGNSRVAFFNELNKLTNKDEANIIYNGKKYVYELINCYEIDKTGKANIVRNSEKTTLTLITCKRKTKKQFVFIFELKMIEGGESE